MIFSYIMTYLAIVNTISLTFCKIKMTRDLNETDKRPYEDILLLLTLAGCSIESLRSVIIWSLASDAWREDRFCFRNSVLGVISFMMLNLAGFWMGTGTFAAIWMCIIFIHATMAWLLDGRIDQSGLLLSLANPSSKTETDARTSSSSHSSSSGSSSAHLQTDLGGSYFEQELYEGDSSIAPDESGSEVASEDTW